MRRVLLAGLLALVLLVPAFGVASTPASAHQLWHLNRVTCRYELWLDLGTTGLHYYSGYSVPAISWYCW